MKRFIILFIGFIYFISVEAKFNTIQKEGERNYIIIERNEPVNEIELQPDSITMGSASDSIEIKDSYRLARNKPKRSNTKGKNGKVKTSEVSPSYYKLSGLSIKSLYQELLDNNIKHPKIVLAQAILETGWFKSSVCRNKGNLFGLTNPKTGQYYEFEHWKESVVAYRDKVQYKYKGGNYLLWLQELGYAEDPRYVSSLIKILEQHFL